MLRTITMSCCLRILAGCVATKSNRHSVKIEDVGKILLKTKMLNCIDYGDKRDCREATALLEKYPWAVEGEVDLTNDNAMRANEAEVELVVARKNMKIIRDRYLDFADKTM